MSDISKCNDTSCPSKDHCYRFTAPPNEHWQSYSDFQRRGRPCCDSYIPIMSNSNKSSCQKVRDANDSIPAKDKGDRDAANKIDKAIDKIDKSGSKGGGSKSSSLI